MRDVWIVLRWLIPVLLLSPAAHAFQTRFPAAASDVVIVRVDDKPPVNGIYYRRYGNRSLVICAKDDLVNRLNQDTPVVHVIFFPGQAGREVQHEARVLGELRGLHAVLEIRADNLDAPKQIDVNLANVTANTQLRVFGIEETDSQQPERFAEFIEAGGTTTDEFRPEQYSVPIQFQIGRPASGALVCDGQGLPWGIYCQYLNRGGRSVTQKNVCVPLSSIETSCQLTLVAGFQTDKTSDQLQHLRINGGIQDRLRRTKRQEIFIGHAADINADFIPGKDRYEKPASDAFQKAPVQWLTGSFYGSFRGVIPRDSGVSTERDTLVQARITDYDGSVWYTVPGLIPAGRLDYDPITEATLARLRSQPKQELTPIKWPDPKPELIDLSADRNAAAGFRFINVEGRSLIKHIPWSTDGKTCYLLDQYGTLTAVTPSEHLHRKRIQLQAWASDITIGTAGILCLCQETLFVIDPATLAVRYSGSVPGMKRIAATTNSDDVWLASDDGLFRMVLTVADSKMAMPTEVKTPVAFRTMITTMMMPPDGKSLIVADTRQIHRFAVTDGKALKWEESSPDLPFSRQCLHQQNDDRLVWLSDRKGPAELPGFPKGHVFVFDTARLSVPQFGANLPTGIDPLSGGILTTTGSIADVKLQLLKSDGSSTEHIFEQRRRSLNRSHLTSFSPAGEFFTAVYDRHAEVLPIPDGIEPGSLRTRPLSDVPTLKDVALGGPTETQNGWTATSLKLEEPVDSAVWLDATTAILLTTDGVLHRVRFPQCVEDASLALPKCTDLIHTKAGLVVRGIDRHLLIVIDPVSLKKLREVAITNPGQITGSSESLFLWMLRQDGKINHYRRPDDTTGVFGVVCLDLEKGGETAAFDARTLVQLTAKKPVPSMKTPWRFTVKPREIRLSPNGQYLFVRDERDLLRFKVLDNELAFDDGLWRLSAGNSGPIAFSPDGNLIAVTQGAIASRPEHPRGGHYGSFIFSVDDFSKVVTETAIYHQNHYIAVSSDADRSFVLSSDPSVSIIEKDQPEATQLTVSAGFGASKLAICPDGKSVLLLGNTNGYLSRTVAQDVEGN